MEHSRFIFNGLLIIKQWTHNDEIESGDILFLMRNETVKEVLFLGGEEWEMNFANVKLPTSPANYPGQAEKVVREIENILIKRKIQLHIIQGSKGPMPGVTKTPTINTTLHYWPLFWAYGSEQYRFNSTQGDKLIDKRQGEHIEPLKLATTFINKGHVHRCYLMDLLARDNYLSKNGIYFSWHNNEVKRGSITSPKEYNFIHWKESGKKVLLDSTFNIKEPISDFHPTPLAAYLGAIHIVSESQQDGIFWTEKTFNPIRWGIPFVIISGAGMNRDLELYGFELYTELFDYGFDDLNLYKDRLEVFLSELSKLRKKYDYKGGLKEIRRLVEPKVHRNRERLKEIILTHKFIPPILYSMMEKYGKHKEDWELFDMNMNLGISYQQLEDTEELK